MKFVLTSCFALGLGLASAQAPSERDAQVAQVIQAATSRQEAQNDVWFKGGDFPRIKQNLRFMVEMDTTNYESASSLGWMLKSTEQPGEEWAVYVRFYKDNTDEPDGAMLLSQFLFDKRQYAAIPLIMEPRLKFGARMHANNYRNLGHSYVRMGMWRDALRVWEAAVAAHPEDAALKLQVVRTKERLGG
ncbi:MAG TPA: hypothetical protein PLB31_05535 [Fimbriimonadaceae bacterium]|nr:hypothetical protein [Armatimonadota bacterium]HCM74126.1 hypothetical protein [Armatimonadota bacterium]HRD31084.1 hypothetical protein [Fimbriimonadaceae bacterium]HRE93474.1 hypothetical protein [Fimbriimonadaceae bacterium]HRI73917.1 hypothetical protein [Fimbriimonadaceae bacterium]